MNAATRQAGDPVNAVERFIHRRKPLRYALVLAVFPAGFVFGEAARLARAIRDYRPETGMADLRRGLRWAQTGSFGPTMPVSDKPATVRRVRDR